MKSGANTFRLPVARPFRFAAAPLAIAGAFVFVSHAAPARSGKKSAAAKSGAKNRSARRRFASAPIKPMPRYVSISTIETLRALRRPYYYGALNPRLDGKQLSPTVHTVPGAIPVGLPQTKSLPKLRSKKASVRGNAQRFPRPIAPARVPRAAVPAVPRWVRYPLEFQLCGIGIGTSAVDKDRFNRIDRYGLFAMHGNPTAVVVSTEAGGTTIQQQPPEVAALFPGGRDGIIPDWAAAITVQLDNNHVEWLYKRDTYAMGFIVDRLGFVDAIVVAGVQSPIARTQLEDPVHTVKLGDDLRKVLFRYGYPDTIETYTAAVGGVSTGGGGGAAGGGLPGAGGGLPGAGGAAGGATGGLPGAAAGGMPGAAAGGGLPGAGAAPGGLGGGAAAGGGAEGNNAYRTFEVRYEQSYNIVFTIRNNRVVRMYIFGDPDFFNARRRRQIRAAF